MSYYIGVVGNINTPEAEEWKRKVSILISNAAEIKEKYEDKDFDDSIYIVSGLIERGITKFAYQIADEMHYGKVGIDARIANSFDDGFKNFTTKYVGKKFGDENEYFIRNIDILLIINPTKRDFDKKETAKIKGIPILSYTKTGKVGGMVAARKKQEEIINAS